MHKDRKEHSTLSRWVDIISWTKILHRSGKLEVLSGQSLVYVSASWAILFDQRTTGGPGIKCGVVLCRAIPKEIHRYAVRALNEYNNVTRID